MGVKKLWDAAKALGSKTRRTEIAKDFIKQSKGVKNLKDLVDTDARMTGKQLMKEAGKQADFEQALVQTADVHGAVKANYNDLTSVTKSQGGIAAMKAGGNNMWRAASEDFMGNYGKQMAWGAGMGALTGGLSEAGQGGNFFEGAAGGIVPGAIYGGLYGSAKAFVGNPGKSGTINSTGRRISNQVKALASNARTSNIAKSYITRGNK